MRNVAFGIACGIACWALLAPTVHAGEVTIGNLLQLETDRKSNIKIEFT